MLRRFDLPHVARAVHNHGMSRRTFSKALRSLAKKKLGVDDINVCSVLQNACPHKASDPGMLLGGNKSSTCDSCG